MIEAHFDELEAVTSTKRACDLLGVSRATCYRRRQPPVAGPAQPRPAPPHKLSEASASMCWRCCARRSTAIWPRRRCGPGCSMTAPICVRSPRCTGCSPSPGRTGNGAASAPTQAKRKPELIATAPNQVWSWDITKLQGPERGVYYELFVIIDIFSRHVVGWMVAPAETGELAEAFIADTLARHGIGRDQLTLHADRGTSMTSKPVAQLLVDLGVARSHSRPHVSNDNPYSEANFKTLKYCPAFPGRFGSIEDARAFCVAFFDHYNHIHRHAGIGLHTPASVHYGTAIEVRAQRAVTLDASYAANPARFGHRRPTPPKLPTVAWINEPTPEALIKSA